MDGEDISGSDRDDENMDSKKSAAATSTNNNTTKNNTKKRLATTVVNDEEATPPPPPKKKKKKKKKSGEKNPGIILYPAHVQGKMARIVQAWIRLYGQPEVYWPDILNALDAVLIREKKKLKSKLTFGNITGKPRYYTHAYHSRDALSQKENCTEIYCHQPRGFGSSGKWGDHGVAFETSFRGDLWKRTGK